MNKECTHIHRERERGRKGQRPDSYFCQGREVGSGSGTVGDKRQFKMQGLLKSEDRHPALL